MDGVAAIAPGGTFDFDFVFRDAGWHWYHPHIGSDEQTDLGLQGTLLMCKESATSPSVQMPPEDSMFTLSASDKALIEQWIVEGALNN